MKRALYYAAEIPLVLLMALGIGLVVCAHKGLRRTR